MDPNSTLRQLREIAGNESTDDLPTWVTDFVGMFQDLDDWLSRGGFQPSDWEQSYKRIRIGEIDF